jgi:glycosyltransferase involved in cell wall biosynthesis
VFSIIIPTYNRAIDLKRALLSLNNQIYKYFEVLICDDGSTDDTSSVVNGFANKLSIRYIKIQNSGKPAVPRNLGIANAKGKYIAFLDVDDLWTKDKLNLQIKEFRNDKIGLVYSNYYILNQVTGLKKIFFKRKLPEGIIYNELLNYYFLGLGTVVIRKDIFIDKKTVFDKRYNIIGDFDFFIKISRDVRFSCIQNPLLIYRVHKNSFSNKNYQMHINELKLWFKRQINIDDHKTYFIQQKIIYIEAILNIFNKKYNLSIKKFFQVHSLRKKINIIIFLLMPNFIFKKLKNNFS